MPGKILVAEDDALTRFMMCEMLDELELDYETAKNGAECEHLIDARPDDYALVLLDIHMPQKTGLEVTQSIRSTRQDPPRDIPIIAVTADQHWQNRARCVEIGFTDVMSKPISMNDLEIQINKALDLS